MLESNLSAMQGLRVDGRVLRESAPALSLEIHRHGKHKAINSIPKLFFISIYMCMSNQQHSVDNF